MDTVALSHLDRPAVAVSGVGHIYTRGNTRKMVLTDVDLSLNRGEFVVLTGPSGAGKTTLMTLIGALRSLQQGSIQVLGTELLGLSARGCRTIRRHTGFIFQTHNLFDALTAFQTLHLAMELGEVRLSTAEALARARSLLAALDMEEYLYARPPNLSTGQNQRLAIARALVNNPAIVLADEPTASLDRASADAAIGLLKRQVRTFGASVLIVSHDTRIFAMADRVVTMVDGQIA
jgi:putative ABC transport system ATP-binding protein